METGRINKVLEYTIFCIENVAKRVNINPAEAYSLMTERTDILRSYVIPSYEALHTQDKEYIVDDILSAMAKKGVVLQ